MRIGIYGSSFDPITNVHLFTASTVAHRARLDKVIFLPCSSQRTDKLIKTSDEDRLHMIRLAIQDNSKFVVDDYELHVMGWNRYTYFTMEHFKEIYPSPEHELFFIMGADLLVDIADGRWQHAEELIRENRFIVMARGQIDMVETIARSALLRQYDDGQRFYLLSKGIDLEISSTYIREEFSRGGEPRYLLPDPCYFYIKKNGLYQEPKASRKVDAS